MQATDKEDFAAQVVAQPAEAMLVEQKGAEAAAMELLLLEAIADCVHGCVFIQNIWPQFAQERMVRNIAVGENGDVGSAVEQGGFACGVDGQSQLAVGGGVIVGFANHPDAVELVVAVNAEGVGEADQHGFAAWFDADDGFAGQLGFEEFEAIEGEENLCGGLVE